MFSRRKISLPLSAPSSLLNSKTRIGSLTDKCQSKDFKGSCHIFYSFSSWILQFSQSRVKLSSLPQTSFTTSVKESLKSHLPRPSPFISLSLLSSVFHKAPLRRLSLPKAIPAVVPQPATLNPALSVSHQPVLALSLDTRAIVTPRVTDVGYEVTSRPSVVSTLMRTVRLNLILMLSALCITDVVTHSQTAVFTSSNNLPLANLAPRRETSRATGNPITPKIHSQTS